MFYFFYKFWAYWFTLTTVTEYVNNILDSMMPF